MDNHTGHGETEKRAGSLEEKGTYGLIENRESEKVLMDRLDFEILISEFSASLINLPDEDLEDEILSWLGRFSSPLGVDRASFMEYLKEENRFRSVRIYTAPWMKPFPPGFQPEPIPYVDQAILRNEIVKWERIPDDLPEEINPADLRIIKDGTKSYLAIPLKAQQSIMGMCVFGAIHKERRWPDDIVRRLGLMGEIIANAMMRKRARESLEKEINQRKFFEERNSMILKSAMVGFWIVDKEGNIKEVNDTYCNMVGYSREELLSMNLYDLDPTYSREEIKEMLKNARDMEATRFEIRHRRKDGGFIDLEVSRSYLPMEDSFFSFFRDITDLKRAESELKERLEFEELVSGFSAALIESPPEDLEKTLSVWLKEFAEYLGVDRAAVSEFSEDKTSVNVLHIYAHPGIPALPGIDKAPNIHSPLFRKLLQGKEVKLSNVDRDLPAGIDRNKVGILRQGTKSILAIPLEVKGDVLGDIVFATFQSERSWPDDLVRRIRLLGEMIANCLIRRRAELEVEERLDFETLSSEFSATLIHMPARDISEELKSWLQRFVEFLGVDRCAISEYEEDLTRFRVVQSYTRPHLDAFPMDQKPRPIMGMITEFQQGRIIRWGPMPDDVPEHLARLRAKIIKEGTKSYLAIPLQVGRSIIGLAVFSSFMDEKRWSDDMIRRLRLWGEIIANLLIRRRAEKELAERLDFEAMISEFSAALINMPIQDLEKELGVWLKRFVEFLNVDRCIVSEYLDNRTHYRNIQSYTSPLIPSRPPSAGPRPIHPFFQGLRCGEIIRWERIPEDLPKDIDPETLQIVQDRTKSLLVIPLEAGSEIIGTLLFASFREQKKWSEDIIRRLRLLGEMIASALIRTQAEKELTEYRDRLEKLVEERTRRLKAAQEELVQKERLATLGKLTAMVSHELRNPLGTIRTSLFSIGQRLHDYEPGVGRALERAERSIIRCDRIIEELLDYTRVRELNLETTRIDEWLDEILDETEIPDGIFLEKEWKAGVGVRLDRERFRRCMINILNNAVQAIEQKGDRGGKRWLRVSTVVEGGRLKIGVDDSGIGIDPESLEKIFEPLYSTKSFGVGLGIPIARQIVEQHGGSINITSGEGPDGTRVVLELPLTENEETN